MTTTIITLVLFIVVRFAFVFGGFGFFADFYRVIFLSICQEKKHFNVFDSQVQNIFHHYTQSVIVN